MTERDESAHTIPTVADMPMENTSDGIPTDMMDIMSVQTMYEAAYGRREHKTTIKIHSGYHEPQGDDAQHRSCRII